LDEDVLNYDENARPSGYSKARKESHIGSFKNQDD